MAEIKNSFLRSKMNKDLDDRLIPNGEYRDAQNISVGKSEDDDIGALETVLGNAIKTFSITPALPDDMQTIGYLTDNYSNTIFVFATNYTDTNPNIEPTYAPLTKRCIIYSWTPNNPATAKIIADGSFLNFSTTNPIQVSLIEELLFFTDNRNQPRKVNITQENNYYTDEVQISVAKYNPYLPISLLKKTTGIVLNQTTTATTFYVLRNTKIEIGMSVISTSSTGTSKINPSDYVKVQNLIDANLGGVLMTVVVLSKQVAAPAVGDRFTFLISTMTNKSSSATWPGDPDYLESRYVRFSYRYRFDDGEYSLFAPFTQIAYIPKQKGYFKNGDENEAFRSTIVAWFENNVNNIELLITLPDDKSTLSTSFKITSLDILYKESDQTTVKVLETIPYSVIDSDGVDNLYTYEYQSRKPYKTLPTDQTIRVYDKVPVRAFSQETAGNRIIYGNFRDTYTAPDNINYDVKIVDKGDSIIGDSWVEYPNHSLKQNRNYQVGFILADKFGRQTPVILSPVKQTIINTYLGSTIFNPYDSAAQNILNWFGNTLQLSITNQIKNLDGGSLPNFDTGEPGVYAQEKGAGFEVTTITEINKAVTIPATTPAQPGYEYNFTVTGSVANVPVINEYLRGEFIDYVKIEKVDATSTPVYKVYTTKPINTELYSASTNVPDSKYSYTLNPTGWYSYKIVVKQTEQDYYNTYFPGILSGYPDQTGNPPPFPSDPTGSTANVVLINDNINKVPRDLAEVGPDQKQFRSSVQLFGRVSNNSGTTNVQYYPDVSTDTAISISTADDSNMDFATLGVNGKLNLYQIDTNPLVARLSTNKNNIIGDTTATMRPFLAIYETEPVDSLLDIFWETGTVGLLSDLNTDIITGFDGPTSFTATNIELIESDAPGHFITDAFFPQSTDGASFDAANPTTATMSVTSVRNGNVTSQFELVQDSTLKSYRIRTASTANGQPANATFVYNDTSITQDAFTFLLQITSTSSPQAFNPSVSLPLNVNLSNFAPSFVNNPLPDVVTTIDKIILPDQDTSAVNGSNDSTRNTEQLKWSIVSGNPTGLNGQPSFAINATTGQLTQTQNNSPNGQHVLVLKIEDANGDTADGGLSATANQNIFVGPEPANTGIISTCLTGPMNAALPGIPITNVLVTKDNVSSGITGVWTLSTSAFTSGGSGGYNISDLPVTPSTAQTGDASLTNTIFKIGDPLTQGSLALSMNAGLQWTTSPPPSGVQGEVTWKVWHRSNSSSSWAHISDLNNTTLGASGKYITLDTANTGSFGNFYNQVILAFNQPGEYVVAAVNAKSLTAAIQAQCITCWVNSNDLNYSTCVIENGVNVTGGTARASYEYGMSTSPQSSYNCSYGTTPAWSNVPYGQYVPQFFTQSNLANPYSFPDVGGGISNYHAYKTQGSSPFDDPSSFRYTFSTRFTTADGKVYKPNPWSQCYIENCGGTAGASSGCSLQQFEFPY